MVETISEAVLTGRPNGHEGGRHGRVEIVVELGLQARLPAVAPARPCANRAKRRVLVR